MSEVPTTSNNSSSTMCDLNDPEGSLYTDFASSSSPLQFVQPSRVGLLGGDDSETTASIDKSNSKKPNRKDWIDTENPLHCKPCDFTANDVQEFQEHSISFKHIKKAAEVLEMKVNNKKDEEKKPVSFVCEVCECTCNSESAWNSHLLGNKHRKNLEKQGAARQMQKQKMKHGGSISMNISSPGPLFNSQFSHKNKPYQKPPWQGSPGAHCANDFLQYKEPLIGLEYVTEIQVSGQNPRYHCQLCDAKFDHNVKFPHLVGAKHRFNVLKEKNPAIAQEIRVGVKKRSELTGKLLEEAMKIEQEEGRQQVKTCVEASPFESSTAPKPLMSQGRGQDHVTRINPMGKLHEKVSGMKRNPNINLLAASDFNTQSSSQFGNNSYGRGRARGRGHQQFQGRGRGGYVPRGRGRGRGYSNNYSQGNNYQNNQQSFQGDYNQQNKQSFTGGYNNPNNQSFTGGFSHQNTQQSYSGSFNHQNTQQDSYQQYQSPSQPSQGYQSPSQPSQGSLLPKEAFRPRSPSRTNFGSSSAPSSFGQGNQTFQDNSWASSNSETNFPPNPTMAADSRVKKTEPKPPSTPQSSENTKHNLFQNLSDLGKLVNSEEDASIALQVSNALTQALLNYRMQNLE